MTLDNRSLEILHMICTSINITSNDIIEKQGLTRNQIDYSLKKINDFLSSKNYETIKRSRQGSFIIDSKVIEIFSKQKIRMKDSHFHKSPLDENYRILIILLMIFSADYLSLFHFIDNLDVSKNTIVSDIKKANKIIEPYDIAISYTRKNGYVFKGAEEDIRGFIIAVVNKLADTYFSDVFFDTYLNVSSTELIQQQYFLNKLENALAVSYTDEQIKNITIFLVLFFRRIKNGFFLKNCFKPLGNDLSTPDDYALVEKIFSKTSIVDNRNELNYLSFLIFSLDVTDAKITHLSQNASTLKKMVEESITLFEEQTLFKLEEKKRLSKILFLHLKSLYYQLCCKLKGYYPLDTIDKDDVSSLYISILNLVSPIEDFFGAKLPKAEIYLIAFFIKSHIKQKELSNIKLGLFPSVVVCPGSYITSRIIQYQLEMWFPTLCFDEALPIRDFYLNEHNLSSRLIFSTEHLHTSLPVINIGTDFFKMNKQQINHHLVEKGYYLDTPETFARQILNIVKQHVILNSSIEKDLLDDFQTLFSSIEPSRNNSNVQG